MGVEPFTYLPAGKYVVELHIASSTEHERREYNVYSTKKRLGALLGALTESLAFSHNGEGGRLKALKFTRSIEF